MRTGEPGTIEHQAERAARAGWDGVAFTDSQNLIGDPFVAATIAARTVQGLKVGTGVSNMATRHPAVLATVAQTVQEETSGRFVFGVGRGDTALFHLGRKPQPVAAFADSLEQVQTYLRGGTIDLDGYPSRLQWIERRRHDKVTLDVACSGPRVIATAARTADMLTFAVGADPERLDWAEEQATAAATEAGRDPGELRFGAYVNVGCHPDPDRARALVAGTVAAFTHFSAMPGSTGEGVPERDRAAVAEVGRRYDSNHHLRNTADHSTVLDAEYIDRFAIVGPPDRCIERLSALRDRGFERVVVVGSGMQADPGDAKLSGRLLATEVLPAVKGES